MVPLGSLISHLNLFEISSFGLAAAQPRPLSFFLFSSLLCREGLVESGGGREAPGN